MVFVHCRAHSYSSYTHYVMKVNNCISILNSSVIGKKTSNRYAATAVMCVCLFFIVLYVIFAQIQSAVSQCFSSQFSNVVNIILFHCNTVRIRSVKYYVFLRVVKLTKSSSLRLCFPI